MMRLSIGALTALALLSQTAFAQPLSRRVADISDGAAQFSFASRPGVCGDGATYVRDGFGDDSRISEGGNYSGRSRGDDWPPCVAGPVRVVATVSGGDVIRLRTYVGRTREQNATGLRDFGTVSVDEATFFLRRVVEQARGRSASDAVLPLVLADSVTPWPTLIRFARDDQLSKSIRSTVAFWLARGASAKLGLVGDHDESPDDEVRGSAVFALSQQPIEVAIPQLIEVAKHNAHASARAQALFWLGQSGDSRAIDLFDEILRGASVVR